MFGAFGLLALGLLYLAVRGMVATKHWSDRWPLRALALFNAAIVLWLVLNLLPVGIAQMAAVIQSGYGYARSLAFYDGVVAFQSVSYTHLRAHETRHDLVCRLLLE